jgi:4-amino-4-deoxy-L-arabinose transferase-like glycosyltransferase
MKKLNKLVEKQKNLILLLGLMVLLRIPSLYEPVWYGDENIYLTIGQGVRKGLVLYREITDFPNKPPMIYWLAAAVRSVFWFRLVLMVWSGLGTVVIYRMAQKLFGKREWVAPGLTLIFVLLTSLPLLEGTIANAEIFMIVPVSLGMLLLWNATLKKQYFWAGLALGGGFLFKIPVAMDIAAAGLIFFGLRRSVGQLIYDRRLYMFLLGVVTPITVALTISMVQGVSPVSLIQNAVGSTGYVSVWRGAPSLVFRLGLLAAITLVFIALRSRLTRVVIFAGVWLSFALFGALLSGRPYPHYLVQVVPALVLLTGTTVGIKLRRWDKVVVSGLVVLLVLAYVRFGFGAYPVVSYYSNFVRFTAGKISQEEYQNGFDSRVVRNYQVAEYLKKHTKDEERVYIWGTEPGIYVLSDRLPVGRLTTSFHVEDLNEYERLGQELGKVKPEYIVVMETESRDFPQLKTLLDSQYVKVKQIGEAEIYRKLVVYN